MRYWRYATISLVVLTIVFFIYIGHLYQTLEAAFLSQQDFVPTRIYSDVTRIAPPHPKKYVETRLKTLGYDLELIMEDQVTAQDNIDRDDEENEDATGPSLVFKLREINYPTYLLPPNHPTLNLAGYPIKLTFDGPDENALLVSIHAEEEEIPEIYLEPEVIARLARSEENSNKIRDLIPFKDVPAVVWKAILAVEDHEFLKHKGLNPKGILRAIWVNLRSLSFKQGGSTITQQLVKNLMARRSKNLFKKFSEIFLSLILEIRHGKEDILERYLNEVYLGQIGSLEVHGVGEGARYFFGKSLDQLNLAETALLSGLIRGPYYYSPYRYLDRAVSRQRLVLEKMVETGFIAEEEAIQAMAEPIRLSPPPKAANKAPWFADYVKAELIHLLSGRLTEGEIIRAGLHVYTTLDLSLNEMAQESVSKGIANLEKKFGIAAPLAVASELEGALATVDHSTGYIRSLVGGRDFGRSTHNRILNMKRQVGSTFKPIVFLAALEKKLNTQGIPYGPGYPVEDAPWKLTFDQGRQTWEPQNYDTEKNRGWISMRQALIHSVNTVAARLGAEVGLDQIIETARKMGVESELPKVPSLTLGVLELSPVELLRVYSTFANLGVQDRLVAIRAITEDNGNPFSHYVYHPSEVLDPGLAAWMTDLLKDVFVNGTARHAYQLGYETPAAGKTGTTSHHRDSWFAGFTPKLTTVVWVGIETGSSLDKSGGEKIKLTGAGTALPIWVDFMKKTESLIPPAPFPVAEILKEVSIDAKTGQRAESGCDSEQVIVERYLEGREPTEETCGPEWPPSITESNLDEPDAQT